MLPRTFSKSLSQCCCKELGCPKLGHCHSKVCGLGDLDDLKKRSRFWGVISRHFIACNFRFFDLASNLSKSLVMYRTFRFQAILNIMRVSKTFISKNCHVHGIGYKLRQIEKYFELCGNISMDSQKKKLIRILCQIMHLSYEVSVSKFPGRGGAMHICITRGRKAGIVCI